jgi:hypothetical protein
MTDGQMDKKGNGCNAPPFFLSIEMINFAKPMYLTITVENLDEIPQLSTELKMQNIVQEYIANEYIPRYQK